MLFGESGLSGVESCMDGTWSENCSSLVEVMGFERGTGRTTGADLSTPDESGS